MIETRSEYRLGDVNPQPDHTNTPLRQDALESLPEPEQKVIERLLAQPTVWEFDASTEAREQLRRLYAYWCRRETTGSAPAPKPPAQGISPKGIESESKVGKI